MTHSSNPFGLHTITPMLIVDDVRSLTRFLHEVFGAVSRGAPSLRDDGSIEHAEVMIDDSIVMMAEPEEDFGAMPAMLYLYVNDCDITYRRALEAGAAAVREPTDYPHGDRYGGVKDPTGNIWWIVTHVGKHEGDS